MVQQCLQRVLWMGAIAGWLGSLLSQPAGAAPEFLTHAQVYKVVNQVQLLPNQKPVRRARLSDVVVPLDAIRTASQSRAELLFNEGSLARIGSSAIFRFVPGTRSFQLRNGTALIMSLPGQVATQIETPGGQVLAQALPPTESAGTPLNPPTPIALALAVHYNAATQTGQYFVLTNGYVTITDLQGHSLTLLAGQTVQIINGVLGPVQTFDLRAFYGSSQLAIGLGPGQERAIAQEILPVQQTLSVIRQATLAAVAAQTRQLEGLCTLNGRGGNSTLATNCITTDQNDALRDWQNRREVTAPRSPEPPIVSPPEIPVRPLPDPKTPTQPLPDPQTPTQPLPDPQKSPNTPLNQGTVILR